MKIMIAVDQSDNWKEIIDSVTKTCWPEDTQFRVLTVVEPFQNNGQNSSVVNLYAKQIESQKRGRAEKILLSARKQLNECLGARIHTELREGSAAEEILESATEWMPDKIVVGAHGANPNRLFPGSLSRSVARQASCSVKIIRLNSAEPPCPEALGAISLIAAKPIA